MTSEVVHKTVTIASGGTASNASTYNDDRISASRPQATALTLVGVYTPSALTGATYTIQTAANPSDTFTNLSTGGSDLTFAGTLVDKYIALDPAVTYGCNLVKILSDGAEGAARDFTLVYRRV